MRNFKAAIILLVVFSIALITCSNKSDSVTGPVVLNQVQMSGTVELPQGLASENISLSIGFGDNEVALDGANPFQIEGNESIPGLAFAYTQDTTPILLSIVSDPQENLEFTINVHTTALALAFMNPLLASADPEVAEAVLDRLESLNELDVLENLLESKLIVNSGALRIDDAEIDSALTDLVVAYLNSYPQEISLLFSDSKNNAEQISTAAEPDIYPSWTVSGLKLEWMGNDTYKLTNSYGRWCYCVTPEDTFFVHPNGDILDLLKLERPFSPSTKEFTMEIDPGDTAYVDIFSYGFLYAAGGEWDSLTHSQQTLAHIGGITTIVVELFTNVVAVITNTPVTFGNDRIATLWNQTGYSFLLNNSAALLKVSEYIRDNKPWDMAFFLTKEIINQAVYNPSYRQFLVEAFGLSLSNDAIKKLAAWVLLPAKVALNVNSVSSVFKTALGLTNGEFAVEFEVSTIIEDFGGVSGQVADATSGSPIVGAIVVLSGDDNNPLNPAHTVTTDADGHYVFNNISTGEKELTASASGYNSSTVTAVIVKDQIITKNIPLQKQSGAVSGRVLNDIYIKNSVTPTTFTKDADIDVYYNTNHTFYHSYSCYEGTYNLTLPVGSWWIVASYDDYHPDSVLVQINSNGSFTAPRDLILVPHNTLSGVIKFNLDNSGDFDDVYQIEFEEIGLAKPAIFDGDCPLGGNAEMVMQMIGVRGNSNYNFDEIGITFNSTQITNYGDYQSGGWEVYGCSGHGITNSVLFTSSRHTCTWDYGYMPIYYFYSADPEYAGCNCGISQPGSITILQWGSELGDLITGSMVITIPGWKTCECSWDDTDQDGHADSWDVDCSYVRMELEFRVSVGTDYQLTWLSDL